jgi:hypothetical protein
MNSTDLDTHRDEYKATIGKLIEEYGDASSMPTEEHYLAGERLRAAYSIFANPDVAVAQVFKTYSIDTRVWHYYVDVDDAESMKIERRMTRADKIASVMKWAAENVGTQITLEKLIDTGGIAYSMAKKITEDRPDVFRKIKRGLFEIRDPKADREADKEAAAKKASEDAAASEGDK